jgi:hypothetical protein
MPEWTQEPWPEFKKWLMKRHSSSSGDCMLNRTDYARARECVNACKDIPDPSVVPELVEELEMARMHIEDPPLTQAMRDEVLSSIDALLTKAKGVDRG